ncbi:unnamed protein product, partial [Owenia fusiformis]
MHTGRIFIAVLVIGLALLVSESYAGKGGGKGKKKMCKPCKSKCNYGKRCKKICNLKPGTKCDDKCWKNCMKKSKPMPDELQYCMDKCRIPPTPPPTTTPRPTRKCRWSEYGEEKLGQCSATCGGGIRTVTRIRYKLYGYAETGDRNCYGSNTDVRTQSCNIQPCWGPPPPPPPQPTPPPIIGKKCRWSEYGAEKRGQCSASCGGGMLTVTRKRTKLYGYAETGDTYCYGSDTVVVRTQLCNIQPCWEPPPPTPPPTYPPPVINCYWGGWTECVYGTCVRNQLPADATCRIHGISKCQRTRHCHCTGKRTGVATYHQCAGLSIEYKHKPCCYSHHYCYWGDWTEWVYGTCVMSHSAATT